MQVTFSLITTIAPGEPESGERFKLMSRRQRRRMTADGRILPFRASGVHIRSWPTLARSYAEAGRLLWISLPTVGGQRLAGSSRPKRDMTGRPCVRPTGYDPREIGTASFRAKYIDTGLRHLPEVALPHSKAR
jgi:hypothetical protein